jgi:hypothetical protein
MIGYVTPFDSNMSYDIPSTVGEPLEIETIPVPVSPFGPAGM